MSRRPVFLSWEGKSQACTSPASPPRPLVTAEEFLSTGSTGVDTKGDQGSPRHRLIQGDALEIERSLSQLGHEGTVDLVYVDPPFASGVDYRHEERLDGHKSGTIVRAAAYQDRWQDGAASYLDMLYPRLLGLKPLLKQTGSVWIHVDWRANYLVRALCDEIFGRERFLNEIVWRRAPNLGRQARSSQFGRTLDTLIVYGRGPESRLTPPERLTPVAPSVARLDQERGRHFTLAPRGDYTDASIAQLEQVGRVYRSPSGTVYIKYWLERDAAGNLCKRQPVDALWTDIPPLRHVSPGERTGYPTQKPIALLERVIRSASPEDGLVLDLFAGSGTTGVAAARCGRRFLLGDESPVAIATCRSRLLREGISSWALQHCATLVESDEPIQFTVDRAGLLEARIRLHYEGKREPVAWSIGPLSDGPFRPSWHAQRGSGRKPGVLSREAHVAVPGENELWHAKVYFVDGCVASRTLRLPDHNLPSSSAGIS